MKKINKFLGLFAISIALVASGCGKKRHSSFKSSHSSHNHGNSGNSASEMFAGQKFSNDRVYFALDRFEITEEHRHAVESIAHYLKKNPKARVVIEGFCDNNGTFEHNMILSRKRASSLKAALAKHGISESRVLNVIGYGFKFEVPHGQDEIDVSRIKWSDKCGRICASNRAARVVIVK